MSLSIFSLEPYITCTDITVPGDLNNASFIASSLRAVDTMGIRLRYSFCGSLLILKIKLNRLRDA